MKPYAFGNPDVQTNLSKNWRVLDAGTKTGVWAPGVSNITQVSAANSKAYYNLQGPLCFYYIVLAWDGGGGGINTGAGGNPSYITGLPYGPNSISGQKSSFDTQYLEAVKYTTGIEVLATYKARLIYVAGVPRISMPVAGGPALVTADAIAVYGSFFRE